VDRIRTSAAEYRNNLITIVDGILSTGATPVFATTTTVPSWNDRHRAHLDSLNEVAEDLMPHRQVQVNDLYSYSLPHLQEWHKPDRVHFSPLGEKQLVKQVSAEIFKALGSEARVLVTDKTRNREMVPKQGEQLP
jgi:lysophospholipase L1-like esterase